MPATLPVDVLSNAALAAVLVLNVATASVDTVEVAMRELFSFARSDDVHEWLVAAGVVPVISVFFKDTKMPTVARLFAVDVLSMLCDFPAACDEVAKYGLYADLLDFANCIDPDEGESTAGIALRQLTIHNDEHVRLLGRVPGAVDKLKAVLDYDFEDLIKTLVDELEELEN